MNKKLFSNVTKMLLIPTLVIGGLSACGYNRGARTNTYDGTRTYGTTYGTPYGANTYGTNYGTTYGTNTYGTNYPGGTAYGPGTYGANTYGAGNMYGTGANAYGSNRWGTNTYGTNYGTNTYGMTGTATNYSNDQRVANRAANEAMNVAGVSRATAVANGNNLVIGIDAKAGTNTKDVEQRVLRTVKAKESGYNVHVTADPNINTRIRNAYNSMTNPTATPGHPVRDLGRDVGSIIRDIGRTVTAPFR
jgi:spore cortex protein